MPTDPPSPLDPWATIDELLIETIGFCSGPDGVFEDVADNISAVRERITQTLAAERQQFTAQLAERDRTIAILRQRCDDFKAIGQGFQRESRAAFEQGCLNLQRALKAEADVASLTQQLADLRRENATLAKHLIQETERLDLARAELLQLTAHLTAQDAEIALVRRHLGERNREVDTLQGQLDQQLTLSADYGQVIETQRQELVKLRAELSSQ